MVFGLDMVYSSSDETVPLWDYCTFNHQCANVINIRDTKMSNVLLSMICSYFAIVTFFFLLFIFRLLSSRCDLDLACWYCCGVDTETSAKYDLNGPTT